jgi:hypothetical protein
LGADHLAELRALDEEVTKRGDASEKKEKKEKKDKKEKEKKDGSR